MRYKIILVWVFLFGIAVIITSQFSIPTLFGADGYLHIRMAEFIKEYGPRYDFHWARYSTFAEHFADKDFLYHLLLIPFTFFSDIFLGAKLSAILFAIFLFVTFFLCIRDYCEKALIPFFLIIFFLSPPFLQAIDQPRNMVFIMGLTLIYIHLLIKKNQWALFIVSLVYSLSHVSGPLLFIFALLGEVSRFMTKREFAAKNIRTVALALFLGYLIHPNFPHNLLSFYLNGILVPIFALKWGLELGAEFFPLSMRDFALGYPFLFIGLILLVATSISQSRKIKSSTVIWMSIAGFFFIFLFFSQRYITHGYTVILISLAAYFSDWWQSGQRLLFLRQHRLAKALLFSGIFLIFALIGFSTYKGFRQRAQAEMAYNQHYERVGKWMSRLIPKGEVIFHANWSDSQYFIGLNPKDDYFVTFDPIYMYYWNPKKYNLYRNIAFSRTADPYTLLKEEFNVRYGYAGKNYFWSLIYQIKSDPRFEILFEDELGIVFRLKS